ncbi:MAG: hypothetical protein IE881_07205 [Epsilonproteobacteria bacterium]|nr:hypothetical protein [Campylobacterota bacterium]
MKSEFVSITYYKEREFYYLNHAIHTKEGFIAKEIKQFHETQKDEFLENLETLKREHPNHEVVTMSLSEEQIVTEKINESDISSKISNTNFVVQRKLDTAGIPATLIFSPFTILYQEYKNILNDNLTLIIGLFDRKLFMMFATKNKIHQSWVIGTRGLSERQVAQRVYKCMQAYYKISFTFADDVEMLVTDDSPKLLKAIHEELGKRIALAQNNIHNLLHNIVTFPNVTHMNFIPREIEKSKKDDLADIRLEDKNKDSISAFKSVESEHKSQYDYDSDEEDVSFLDKIKSMFRSKKTTSTLSLVAILPFLFSVITGGIFFLKNNQLEEKLALRDAQMTSQLYNQNLVSISDKIFRAIGKNGEIKSGLISEKSISLKGVVWGIEPLRESLISIYNESDFVIKPLGNMSTEFSFKTK